MKDDEKDLKTLARDEWLESAHTASLLTTVKKRRESILRALVIAASDSSDPKVRGIAGQLQGCDDQIKMLSKGEA